MPTLEPNAPRLAALLRRAARSAGYDLDQPRSGAIKGIAQKTGLQQSTVSRAFQGIHVPSPVTLQGLADVLNLTALELLLAANVIRPPEGTSAPSTFPHTARDAAIELGIAPADQELFVAFVDRLLAKPTGGGPSEVNDNDLQGTDEN